jgi:hypothetical protein
MANYGDPTNNTTGAPTQWNFNPTVNTSNDLTYPDTGTEYGSTTQPYGGYTSTDGNPYNWKNATTWTSSLVYPAEQQYYGGPSYVPLYGAPTAWDLNPGMINQAGQYVSSLSGSANVYPYDQSTREYDQTAVTYDGTNGTLPFYNWKQPTSWTPIAGGNSL